MNTLLTVKNTQYIVLWSAAVGIGQVRHNTQYMSIYCCNNAEENNLWVIAVGFDKLNCKKKLTWFSFQCALIYLLLPIQLPRIQLFKKYYSVLWFNKETLTLLLCLVL